MTRYIFLIPLTVFLVLGLYFAAGLTRNPSLIPSVLIDRATPEFDLPPIKGYEQGLATEDLSGEVAMINVFASWCVACEVEHPMLMELAKSQDVPIMGLNWKDKPGDGTAWLRRNGDPYALIGDDAKGRTAIDFGVTGAPETFIIDKSGRIRYKQIGPITPRIWRETLKPLIEDLENADAEDTAGVDDDAVGGDADREPGARS
ncbi:MAG: DsbE family thiol:disulfide interchange protein [Parvularculaceae bacterium]